MVLGESKLMNKQKLIKKGLIYSLGENMIKFFLSFFIGIYIGRALGPERFGEYNYYLTIAGLVYSFSLFGLDTILIKVIIGKKENEQNLWLYSAIFLQSILMVFEIIILYLIKDIIELKSIFFIAGIAYIFKGLENIKFYNLSHYRGDKNSKINLVVLIVSNLLKIGYIIFYDKIEILLVIVAISEIFRSVLYFKSYIKQNRKKDKIKIEWKKIKYLIKVGAPLFISALSVNLYMRIDQIMIKNMLNNQELGIYSVAVKFTEIWYLIPGIIIPIFLSNIIEKKSKGIKEYKEIIISLVGLLTIISIILIIPLIVFSRQIVLLTYGKEYMGAINILNWYSLLIFITFIGSFRGKYLIIENKQKYLVLFGLIGLIINIILNYFLIPNYKGLGATAASIISQLITNFLILFLFKSTRSIGKMQLQGIIYMFKIKENIKKIME